ncbi:hypothetical protein X777_14392 [Ooceraea biroi]|uniref:Uncharacterized protein n=1 Tax=Ooceraea biroi TaxID=2015173 RepID=A0A026WUU4_OOCBI|nr:hypothetical protein X777_14392 [Ooceraea biroi]
MEGTATELRFSTRNTGCVPQADPPDIRYPLRHSIFNWTGRAPPDTTRENEEATERAALLSRDSTACATKRNLEEIIVTASEDNRIESLEVQLEHIRMMQIKANISRMKYRSVCSELKEKSVLYASSLKDLEDGIRRQESEIKRLQARSRAEQRVAERKMELERLERMIFYTRPRDDFEIRGKSRIQAQEVAIKDELARLEDAFVKLQNATGVSRSEEVLGRFLSQQSTKDSLQKMRAATEQEKMVLEKKRQELTAEIETRKFSETKSAEQ